MFLKPKIKLKVNGKDETQNLRIQSLSYNDYSKDSIDTLSLTCAPNAKTLNFGDRCELYLGYKSYNFFGSFYISSIKENYLTSMEYEALSIDFSKGLKNPKNRSFKTQPVKDIIESIARENNLKAKIDFDKSNTYVFIEQNNASDTSLLNDIAKDFNANFVIKNDTLIFLDKDKDKAKEDLIYSLDASSLSSLSIEHNNKTDYKSLIAHYLDLETNTTKSLKVGKGEPSISKNYSLANQAFSLSEIRLKAESDLLKLNEGLTKGSFTKVGGVIFAGAFLDLKLRGEIKRYLLTQVSHTLSPESWSMSANFE
ncbi:hypothetical protein [Helicobacter sp. 11S02629-2]|uniref:phage late control D family protein n=1 Tax=Helicobacter sp. 11S02629-2 TaxID=1476195 RepID=UPI000BA4FBB0|nr:hypothetical protein [Helicobacter sp. 11S02629-2]PAF44161.1 hypothetical protein BKH40_06080 [Helicobacter sp. 11S02629-2]